MKYKVITTDKGKIVVDESAEIKENTYYENNGVVFLSDSIYNEGNNPNNSNPRVTDFNNKVIATINHSISLDVLMVIVQNEIKESLENHYSDGTPKEKIAFLFGYKAAQQKGVYSEEQVRSVIETANIALANNIKSLDSDKIIQSLNQEYIELEMETSYLDWKKGDKEKLSDTLQIRTDRVDGQLMAYQK